MCMGRPCPGKVPVESLVRFKRERPRREAEGPWLFRYREAAERFLGCGILSKGFAYFKCPSCAAGMLMRQMAVRCPEAGCVPGVVAVVQTSGDTLNFNPHVHIIATTHCLSPSGRLFKVPYIPYVKKYLNGFNLNGETQDWVYDLSVSKRLAQYVLKPAMAESRVVFYDPERSKVFYVGRGPKDPETRKRRSMRMCMDSAEFLARLLVQVPPKGQKLVNYYGFYSNKVRGMWAKRGFRLATLVKRIRRLKRERSWRTKLWRVYEVDPLICPSCGEELVPLDLVFPPFSSILAQGP